MTTKKANNFTPKHSKSKKLVKSQGAIYFLQLKTNNQYSNFVQLLNSDKCKLIENYLLLERQNDIYLMLLTDLGIKHEDIEHYKNS